uniref:DUF538 domain-containing protein n=1 Tax=Salmonella sp. s58078 TaxID=3159699 RepID=UPI0039818532
ISLIEKMSAELIQTHREKAVVYTGVGVCKEKARELFKKFSLPNAIVLLDDVTEFGYNESTGFFWLKREKKVEQVHPKLGSKGSFDAEVTGFIEERHITKLKGFKVKEMLLWVPIVEATISDPASGKITFNTPAKITKSFPISTFEED